MERDEFDGLLDSHTTKVHHISYGDRGFFNHMSHGLTALYHLGADEVRLERFVQWYSERLEKSADHTEQWNAPPFGDLDEIKGEKKSFYHLLEHYLGKLEMTYGGDMAATIRGELPGLADGMLCAAFHGIIHLGYGFITKHHRIFAEGLATLHYSHTKIHASEEKLAEPLGIPGNVDILDVLKTVKEDKELSNYLRGASENLQGPMAKKFPNPFGRGMMILTQRRPDDIMRYVDRICLPASYQKVQDGDLGSLEALSDWIINCAVQMYSFSEKMNDFFFIHGVTSSWCLKYLLSAMTKVEDINKLTRVFLCGVISTYLVQGCPDLHPQYAENRNTKGDSFWNDIIKEALGQDELDEHIYKLIDVCKSMSDSKEYKDMEMVYRAAARGALDELMTF